MWKDILSLIADHHNSDCSVLFFTNEDKSYTVELTHFLQYSEINRLSNSSLKYEIIKELLDTIKINDLHKSERKLVIRSAINEVFKAMVRSISLTCLTLLNSSGKNMMNYMRFTQRGFL